MKNAGIYSIHQISLDRTVYVGSSKNIDNRVKGHVYGLEAGNHHNAYLQAVWNKYGPSDFEFRIKEQVDIISPDGDYLLELEQLYIDLLEPICNIASPAPQRGRKHFDTAPNRRRYARYIKESARRASKPWLVINPINPTSAYIPTHEYVARGQCGCALDNCIDMGDERTADEVRRFIVSGHTVERVLIGSCGEITTPHRCLHHVTDRLFGGLQ